MSEKRIPTLGWKNGFGEGPDFGLSTVYDLIDVIRQKPGLFIGEPTVTGMWHFLHGFGLGLHSVGAGFAEPSSPPWGDFDAWIAERLGHPNSSAGWRSMLLERSGDEEKALARFFEEVDAFRSARAH